MLGRSMAAGRALREALSASVAAHGETTGPCVPVVEVVSAARSMDWTRFAVTG